MPKIGVIDCNNFFVSCERVFRPDLKNKPVVVLSGNDGCVVARSKEIKDMGISMGVPYFQIKDILQKSGATVFSSNFALYRDISRRVFNTIKSELDHIEPYSIDECFFLLLDKEINKLEKLKLRIEREVGIPVSIGVADSKTQAKYVNGVAKRTQAVEIWDQPKWLNHVNEIRLSEIWGVGKSHVQSFSKQGLQTVADFLNLPENYIKNHFGISGERLYFELKGTSVFSVETTPEQQKSVMSSRSLAVPAEGYETLEVEIVNHIHSVTKDLIGMNLVADALNIYAYPSRYSDFIMEGFSRKVSFDVATNDLFQLTKEGIKLLRNAYKKGVPYKRIGVAVFGLRPQNSLSTSLFVSENNLKTQELSDLVFTINSKHKEMVRLGGLTKRIESKNVNKRHLSPAYTTNWTSLKIVKT